MAEAGAETPGSEELKDTQVSSDDLGSTAELMAARPRRVFDGERVTEAETPAEEEAGPEVLPDGEVKAEPAAEPEKFTPKHKTWEETERARREAESTMTKANQKAAEEEKARIKAEEEAAAVRKELEDLKAAQAAPAAEPAQVEPAKPVTKAEQKSRIKTALATIRSIAEDDPDYDEKVAEAWAEAGVGTSAVPIPDQKEIAKETAKIVREELKAEQTAKDAKTETERRQEAAVRVREDADAAATKAGLQMEPGSADHRLFWDLAKEVPAELRTKPLKDQVDWTVKEVQRLKTGVVQTTEAERERARRAQLNNAVLEKGDTRPAPKKGANDEPYTTSSLKNEVMRERVIR
jgi:hypothetical protein